LECNNNNNNNNETNTQANYSPTERISKFVINAISLGINVISLAPKKKH
jgi:hypothetical protein